MLLCDVLYVPELQCNFISVSKVSTKDIVKFDEKAARIIVAKGKTILSATKVGELFLFCCAREKAFFIGHE